MQAIEQGSSIKITKIKNNTIGLYVNKYLYLFIYLLFIMY